MVARSLANGVATACTHDELIRAVWGDTTAWRHERSYTRENLREPLRGTRAHVEELLDACEDAAALVDRLTG